jgi:hypothetical protein
VKEAGGEGGRGVVCGVVLDIASSARIDATDVGDGGPVMVRKGSGIGPDRVNSGVGGVGLGIFV